MICLLHRFHIMLNPLLRVNYFFCVKLEATEKCCCFPVSKLAAYLIAFSVKFVNTDEVLEVTSIARELIE